MRALSALAAVLALTASAQADDMYRPGSAYDWSGLYGGAYAGFAANQTKAATTLLDINDEKYIDEHPARNAFAGSGAIAGVQAGFNHQTANGLVFGVEGDIALSGLKGSFNYDFKTKRPEAVAGNEASWIATVRGRVGAALDRTLVYATAGAAFAGFHAYANNVWSPAPADDVASDDGVITGWTVGGGIEVALDDSWSLKGEYLYARFLRSKDMVSTAYPAGTRMVTDSAIDTHLFRIGVNYRFR